MAHGQIIQGETVLISFLSSTSGSAVGFTHIPLYDANGSTRLVQPWERLIVDDLDGSVGGVAILITAGSTAASSTLIAVPAVNNSGVVTAADLFFIDAKEGVSCPVGVELYTYTRTSTGLGAAIGITGSGRITTAGMPGVQGGASNSGGGRPNWRELTTARGNF